MLSKANRRKFIVQVKAQGKLREAKRLFKRFVETDAPFSAKISGCTLTLKSEELTDILNLGREVFDSLEATGCAPLLTLSVDIPENLGF
jgi:DNA helicase TIP49 (TBP-interacting protein)